MPLYTLNSWNVSTKNRKLRSLHSWIARLLLCCMITQNHMWLRWLVRPLSTLVGKLWCTHHIPQISQPSDYRLFHSLDNHLRGRQFRTPDDVKRALDGFFASRSKQFYHIGVHRLPSRWQKVLYADGNYFWSYRYNFHQCVAFWSVESNSDRTFLVTFIKCNYSFT
jgi:hypothetical protein